MSITSPVLGVCGAAVYVRYNSDDIINRSLDNFSYLLIDRKLEADGLISFTFDGSPIVGAL